MSLRHEGPYVVESLANGYLRVKPAWPGWGPMACATVEDAKEGLNWCAACRCNHIGGFISRMALAEELERLLNRMAKPKRRKKAKVALEAAQPIITEAVKINLRAFAPIDGVTYAQARVLEAQLAIDAALRARGAKEGTT